MNMVLSIGARRIGREAWQRGPVILAWDETEHAGYVDGHNLVIHEFAHKLDMQNGRQRIPAPASRDGSHRVDACL